MKNTPENRELITRHFAGSEFKEGAKTDTPLMMFGKGWGQWLLLLVTIKFDNDVSYLMPYIELEYSPVISQSRYYYMDLTPENIAKLPKTEKEFMYEYYPQMSSRKKDWRKKTNK